MIIKDIKNSISFLTRLPVGMSYNTFEDVAVKMHYFPLVGFIIGFLTSIIVWLIGGGPFTFIFYPTLPSQALIRIPNLLLGFILLGLIIYFTGLHHTDGLMDFGDGLMAHGSKEKKIKALKDVNVGVGGNSLAFIVLIITGISFGYFNFNSIIVLTILTEISAKLSMVTAAAFGKAAQEEGMGEVFIRNVNRNIFCKALLLSILLSILAFMIQGLINLSFFSAIFNLYSNMGTGWSLVLLSFFIFLKNMILWVPVILIAIIIPFFMIRISNRNFGGLTGDVFGAINEITRMLSAVIVLLLFNSFFLG